MSENLPECPDEQIQSLAHRVEWQLRQHPAARPFLAQWPALKAERPMRACRLPVCDWLTNVLQHAVPSTVALVQDIVSAADALDWRQTYSAADFGPAFLERYGWSELIGLRGPIRSRNVACGFLLLGPWIEYPAHAHAAEEFYLPLAGTALWMRGAQGFAARPPGVAITHEPWAVHAMRTQAEPLLALYLWRAGDLAAKSTIFGRG